MQMLMHIQGPKSTRLVNTGRTGIISSFITFSVINTGETSPVGRIQLWMDFSVKMKVTAWKR